MEWIVVRVSWYGAHVVQSFAIYAAMDLLSACLLYRLSLEFFKGQAACGEEQTTAKDVAEAEQATSRHVQSREECHTRARNAALLFLFNPLTIAVCAAWSSAVLEPVAFFAALLGGICRVSPIGE